MIRGTTFGLCLFETDGSIIEPDAELHFGLLLVLASAGADGVPRDDLVHLFWPGELRSGRQCLRQAIYRLRQLDVQLRSRGDRLSVDERFESDLRTILHGTPTPEQVVRAGRAPFLPTYSPKLGNTFRRWLEELRERVAGRLRLLLAEQLAAAQARGRFTEMGEIARALLQQDPLNESGTLALAESMVMEGSKVEAIRLLEQYESEVGAIHDDLRIAPRTLRRRVAECVDDSLLPDRFEVPFVGRVEEHATLRAAWREARSGAAGCVVLTGEAGIGKTRLANEVLRLAALDGTTIATYSASTGDSFTPISTLVSVGRALLALPGALGCSHEELQYIQQLGTPDTTNVWSIAGMAADIAYAQLVHAFAELVRAISDEGPLVLFLDDAQRLHQTSWRVMFDLLDRTTESPFLLVFATHRLPTWFGSVCNATCRRLTRQLRLAPFTSEESQAFLERWEEKHRDAISPVDEVTFARTAAGNPFYLGELAAHAARGGDVRRAPASIQELITTQHISLGKAAQRLLMVIALFEGRATLSRVTQVMDQPADDFMASLEELEEAGLVLAKGAVLKCKHALVGETAIALAMEGVQMFARVRIAELLEREADETNSVELLGDCVTHWERAGETHRAYQSAMKLGGRLVGLGMGTDAEDAYGRAKGLAADDPEYLEAAKGLVSAHRLCANWSGVIDELESWAAHSPELSRELQSNPEHELSLEEARLFHLAGIGDYSRLLLLARQEDAALSLRCRAATLVAMHGDNNFNAALIVSAYDCLSPSQREQCDPNDTLLLDLVYHASIGDKWRVLSLATDYANASLGESNKRIAIHGSRRAANALLRVGYYSEAESILTRVLEMCIRYKLPLQEFATLDLIIKAHLARGSVDMCDGHLGRLRDLAREHSTPQTLVGATVVSALFRWLRKDRRPTDDAFPKIPSDLPGLTSARHAVLVANLASVMLDQRAVQITTLEECVALSSKAAGFGGQDIHLDIVCAALRNAKRSAEATKLAEQYLGELRREISPPFALILPEYREGNQAIAG